MNRPNTNRPTEIPVNECILSDAHVVAALAFVNEADADPLAVLPPLQFQLTCHFDEMRRDLIEIGVPHTLAWSFAAKAYRLAAVSAVAVHEAIWSAVLPTDSD